MTLRDELAAVLGPGNNDQIAYEQAGYVIQVLEKNGIISDWDGNNETADTHMDHNVLNFARGTVQDYINGRPAQDVLDELVQALL